MQITVVGEAVFSWVNRAMFLWNLGNNNLFKTSCCSQDQVSGIPVWVDNGKQSELWLTVVLSAWTYKNTVSSILRISCWLLLQQPS